MFAFLGRGEININLSLVANGVYTRTVYIWPRFSSSLEQISDRVLVKSQTLLMLNMISAGRTLFIGPSPNEH